MRSTIQSAIERLVSAGLATKATVQGCSGEEIADLQRRIGLDLPKRYVEFLARCGRGAGEFLVGTAWTLPELEGLTREATELLHRCGVDAQLPPTAFVFEMHQGYTFFYFDCAAGDDPPVYLYEEGDSAPRRVFDTFSQCFSRCVDDHINS